MKNKILLLTLFIFCASPFLKAQTPVDSIIQPNTNIILTDEPNDSVMKIYRALPHNQLYKLNPAVDLTVSVLGAAGALTGLYLLGQKKQNDVSTILNLNPEKDIIPFNRSAIHNFNPALGKPGDIILYGGCVYGLVLLLDKDIRQDAAKIGLMYLETLLLTASSYTLTAGNVNKLRPYAYNTDTTMVNGEKVPEVPMDTRTSANATNSFYGGHPSVPAATGMFVASVFAAYHPHSPVRFVFYGVAAASTATLAYLRYKGGNHFPTDIIIGVGLGTVYGLLVPKLHRVKENKRIDISMLTGKAKGLHMQYTF